MKSVETNPRHWSPVKPGHQGRPSERASDDYEPRPGTCDHQCTCAYMTLAGWINHRTATSNMIHSIAVPTRLSSHISRMYDRRAPGESSSSPACDPSIQYESLFRPPGLIFSAHSHVHALHDCQVDPGSMQYFEDHEKANRLKSCRDCIEIGWRVAKLCTRAHETHVQLDRDEEYR